MIFHLYICMSWTFFLDCVFLAYLYCMKKGLPIISFGTNHFFQNLVKGPAPLQTLLGSLKCWEHIVMGHLFWNDSVAIFVIVVFKKIPDMLHPWDFCLCLALSRKHK